MRSPQWLSRDTEDSKEGVEEQLIIELMAMKMQSMYNHIPKNVSFSIVSVLLLRGRVVFQLSDIPSQWLTS